MPRKANEWEQWFARREGSKSAMRRARPKNSMAVSVPHVVFERKFFDDEWKKSRIRDYADYRRKFPTSAEKELDTILRGVNGGVLLGLFQREHVVSGKWIVDFFFPTIRLAIEVDGSYHLIETQIKKDSLKDSDCARFDITVLRLLNSEIFGDREVLLSRLREGWSCAKRRENKLIGRQLPPEA
jgi:very-short-patch-repair endonuclease